MDLYFLRHGIAADRFEWSGSDADRPLTGKGRLRIELIARRLAGVVDFDLVLTSPQLRALQTAEIVAGFVTVDQGPLVDDRLAYGFDLQGLSEIVDQYAALESLLLVGHEPGFSTVVGQLIGGGRVRFKKGTLAKVRLGLPESLQGELLDLLTPKMMIG
ncbi:MAG: histidine phosphatase family protein [Anaerolineales bacterium]|nr:histidine phosphatase family protein [Anaerolineales bacterium]